MFNNNKIIFGGIFLVLVMLVIGFYLIITQGKKNELLSNQYFLSSAKNINSVSSQEKDNPYKKVEEIEILGEKWVVNNIKQDGSFVYLSNVDKGEINGKNNIIRQLLLFRVVAKLCKAGDKEMCKIHKRNLNYIFNNNIYQVKKINGQNIGYVMHDGMARLGSSAFLIRLLVSSPYFDDYRQQAEALVRGIKYLQNNNDGSFYQPLFFENGLSEKEAEHKMTFYSGEAILSLMEYYKKTNDAIALDMAKQAEDYYLKKYVDNIDEYYTPIYVPWHTLAMSKLWHTTGDIKYLEAVFKLNDKLLEIQDIYGEKGRFFNQDYLKYGKPHSASDAIYSESLVKAYQLALENKNKKRQIKYMTAIRLSLNNLASLQYCNSQNMVKNVPNSFCGALQVRKRARVSRVDSLAHSLDFVYSLKSVLELK